MGNAHYFAVDNIAEYEKGLRAGNYAVEVTQGWTLYTKVLSQALVKYYGFWKSAGTDRPTTVRVTYEFLQGGVPMRKLAHELRSLNWLYLRALPIWKTRLPPKGRTCMNRAKAVQDFLRKHRELLACLEYPSAGPQTEGNHSFNLELASSPVELDICFEFIKALLTARRPDSILYGRRQLDKPALQRDGWIRRYAGMHRRLGWKAIEIAKEIQKELRQGTWNERSKLQYNLAWNTICKIAGMKIYHPT